MSRKVITPRMKSWEHTDDLPSGVRSWAEDITGSLSGLYEEATDDSTDIDFDFYKQEKERMINSEPVNWVIEGSERTVIGLGITWAGKPIFDGWNRTVLKIQPSAAVGHSMETTAANEEAIATYDEICRRGDDDLISPLFAAAEDGTWIAQEYALPIDPPLNADNPPRDWIRGSPAKNLRDDFQEVCEERGLSVSTSRGNVGVNQNGDTVLLDIGGHTAYQDTP
jgi:hypothetical protein